MGYAEEILAQPSTGMCYHIRKAIWERHFKTNPAPGPDTYWERVLGLTPGERAVMLAFTFSEEVHNGGFHQFFSNGDGFRRAHATAEGLELLGFPEMATFLRRAIKICHIPEPVPADYEFDTLMPEEGGEDLMTPLSELDTEFYRAYTNKDWPKRLVDFVRAHPDEFL
jgi:hypothetical protein